MELPNAVHFDASQQRARPELAVGHPLGDGSAAVRCAPARRWRSFPMFFLVRRRVEHLQHSERRRRDFLIRVAALQKIGLLEEVVTLREEPDRRGDPSLATTSDLIVFGFGRLGQMIPGRRLLQLLPIWDSSTVQTRWRAAIDVVRGSRAVRLGENARNPGRHSARLERHGRRIRAGRDAQPADVVLIVAVEIEGERRHRPCGNAQRSLHFIDRGMVVSELRINGPTGFRIGVDRRPHRQAGLFERRARIATSFSFSGAGAARLPSVSGRATVTREIGQQRNFRCSPARPALTIDGSPLPRWRMRGDASSASCARDEGVRVELSGLCPVARIEPIVHAA